MAAVMGSASAMIPGVRYQRNIGICDAVINAHAVKPEARSSAAGAIAAPPARATAPKIRATGGHTNTSASPITVPARRPDGEVELGVRRARNHGPDFAQASVATHAPHLAREPQPGAAAVQPTVILDATGQRTVVDDCARNRFDASAAG